MRRLLAPTFPFDPRRVPFFYGWVVVVAATLGTLLSIPGQTMGVSAFTDALLATTGTSRLAFSNAYLLGTLGGAVLLPRAGVLVDRIGVRLTAVWAGLGLGVAAWALSWSGSVVEGLVGWSGLDPTVVTFAVLALCFTLLRFSGQGVMTLTCNTMLARWFERRRGLASAVRSTVVSFGFAFAPRVLDAWTAAAGWDGALRGIAWTVGVATVVLAVFLFRESPEACGMQVDGGVAPAADDRAQPRPAEPSATRKEALCTRAFWVVTLGLALHGMVITGITLHIVDLGSENGLARTEVMSIFLPMAVCSTVSGAFLGWLSDRVSVRALCLWLLAAESLGYALSAHLGSGLGFWLAAAALGVSSGAFTVLTAVGHARLFGRLHLGAINGASMSAVIVGSALGPSAFAWSREFLGSYQPALYASALLPLPVLALALRSKRAAR